MLNKIKNSLYSWLTVKRLQRAGADIKAIENPKNLGVNDADISMFIAPANSAGQGWAWARAAENAGAESAATKISALNMQFVHGDEVFKYEANQYVHSGIGAHSKKWQKEQLKSLQTFDYLIIESAEPVLGSYKNYSVLAQLQELQAKGAKAALLFHGSDLRDPDLHIKRNENSYFKVDETFAESMRKKTAKSQQLIKESGLPGFVSTPDLLDYAPNAQWLPVVVDTNKWRTTTKPFEIKALPKVVHAPSKSFIKGSDLIDPVLEKMHQKGLINYERVSGVSHTEMIEIYKTADIVVDQMRGGPYGVAACEAMAAGRVVISHVPNDLRDRVLKLTGSQLPIIEARPHNLADIILETIKNPTKAREIAENGVSYVQKIHDGTKSGLILRDWVEGEL